MVFRKINFTFDLNWCQNRYALCFASKINCMKNLNSEFNKVIFFLFTISMFQISHLMETLAQGTGINEYINKYRKGEIVIIAKPGDKIFVEQLNHEFWFGCAISNSIVGGSMSANDISKYKEKFLENFNSAVTENALKWGNMERRKGEVNYSTADGILKWTDENHIPLRGHNLFWGISQFVQPWVKEMDDKELMQTLQNRAETITSRYKGRFAEYDLNNEMIHGNYYEERLGPDITKLMAQWAHNGDPDSKLFLNDYDILTGNRLAD